MFKKKCVCVCDFCVCAKHIFYSGDVPHILQCVHLKIGADWLPLEARRGIRQRETESGVLRVFILIYGNV